MSQYVVPLMFLIVLCASIVLKKNSYQSFIDGAGQAIALMVKVFPYLLAIMMAVEVFRESGASIIIAKIVSPFFKIFGIPAECAELMLVRPLSGAGALAVLNDLYRIYGTDTHIGMCASVIYGSSETIFYISTIYFSTVKIKSLRYAIPVALFATFAGCVIGCNIV